MGMEVERKQRARRGRECSGCGFVGVRQCISGLARGAWDWKFAPEGTPAVEKE